MEWSRRAQKNAIELRIKMVIIQDFDDVVTISISF